MQRASVSTKILEGYSKVQGSKIDLFDCVSVPHIMPSSLSRYGLVSPPLKCSLHIVQKLGLCRHQSVELFDKP
jgi:hypothetical protein